MFFMLTFPVELSYPGTKQCCVMLLFHFKLIKLVEMSLKHPSTHTYHLFSSLWENKLKVVRVHHKLSGSTDKAVLHSTTDSVFNLKLHEQISRHNYDLEENITQRH